MCTAKQNSKNALSFFVTQTQIKTSLCLERAIQARVKCRDRCSSHNFDTRRICLVGFLSPATLYRGKIPLYPLNGGLCESQCQPGHFGQKLICCPCWKLTTNRVTQLVALQLYRLHYSVRYSVITGMIKVLPYSWM